MVNTAMIFAALSCVALTFGAGVLNLPFAMAHVGLGIGLPLLLFGLFGTYYTAWQLFRLTEDIVLSDGLRQQREDVDQDQERDTSIVSEVDPLVQNETRPNPLLMTDSPYAKIPYVRLAYQLYGVFGAVVVLLCTIGTLLGANVVYLIVTANNLKALPGAQDRLPAAQTIVVYVCIVALFCSPKFAAMKDSKPFILAAVLMTFTGVVIMWPLVFLYHPDDTPPTPKLQGSAFTQAFGSVMFSFAGHSAFPSYHAHMERDHPHFGMSVIVAYVYMAIMLVPFVCAVATLYGTTVKNNFVLSIPESTATVVANFGFTAHVFTALAVTVFPLSDMLNYAFTEATGVQATNIGKQLFAVVVQALGGALAIIFFDSFEQVVSFIGATTGGMLTFVLPPVFYLTHRFKTNDRIHTLAFALHAAASLTIIVGGLAALVLTMRNP